MDISPNELAASLLLALLAGHAGVIKIDAIGGALSLAVSVADKGRMSEGMVMCPSVPGVN